MPLWLPARKLRRTVASSRRPDSRAHAVLLVRLSDGRYPVAFEATGRNRSRIQRVDGSGEV
jgi:hypothetical protein